MQPVRVATPDGLHLAAYEAGNPRGREILFIHGFNQCHLSWTKQFNDAALAKDFRMVAFDLRGHGVSDKPADKTRYADDKLWGDDVAAVIAATKLRRPVLAGWSFGGRVVSDYLRTHGAGGIAGINYVAAVTKSDSSLLGPATQHIANMFSDDLATNTAGTLGFLRACFERQPSVEEFEIMLSYNMMVPPHVRAGVLDRKPNPGDMLATLKLPVLVTQGVKDQFVLKAFGEFTASVIEGSLLSLYDDVGHSPFLEDAMRFNLELTEFVRAANSASS